MPTNKPKDGRNCQRLVWLQRFEMDVKIETKTGDLREEKSGFHYCFLRPTEWETDVMIA